MATETEKNAQSRNEKPTKAVTKSVAKMTLPELPETKAVQQRFLTVLGTNEAIFIASLIYEGEIKSQNRIIGEI